MGDRFDAIVVGASLAGSTAATLLGRRGLRVALLERATDPQAYKKTCTHYIQACGTKTLERLGLIEPLERAGAVRNSVDLCTPYGWIRHEGDWYGYNVRRETLDPMLRELAAKTPGVDLRFGHAVKELTQDRGRVTGVVAESSGGARVELEAPLVVAADGRHSKVAEMADIGAQQAPNNRFFYYAYYRMPEYQGRRSRIWLLNPDVAYVFPNDGGLTCVATMGTKDTLPAFRADLDTSFRRTFEGLPEAPDLALAERASDFHGMLEMTNHIRRASRPGIALVGDAAMASDPILGVGCGWALQSAEWLADDVSAALAGEGNLDDALRLYARHHEERLRAHHELINAVSLAKPFNAIEQTIFRAAASDRAFAETFGRLGSRMVHPSDVMTVGTLARAFWLRMTRKVPEPVTLPARPAFA
jgi:flavin-dependent dehydrogenase